MMQLAMPKGRLGGKLKHSVKPSGNRLVSLENKEATVSATSTFSPPGPVVITGPGFFAFRQSRQMNRQERGRYQAGKM